MASLSLAPPARSALDGGRQANQEEAIFTFTLAAVLPDEAPAGDDLPSVMTASQTPARRRPTATRRARRAASPSAWEGASGGDQGTTPQAVAAAGPNPADSVGAGVASGEPSGGAATGAAHTVGAGAAAVGAAVTPADRRRAIERYLREVLTPRIRAHTIYPEEAERLGLEADFVVRIAVDGQGGLVEATLLGAPPHALLKRSAFLALRTSAPWPPPPPLLGTLVQIDVPFVFRLDG